MGHCVVPWPKLGSLSLSWGRGRDLRLEGFGKGRMRAGIAFLLASSRRRAPSTFGGRGCQVSRKDQREEQSCRGHSIKSTPAGPRQHEQGPGCVPHRAHPSGRGWHLYAISLILRM